MTKKTIKILFMHGMESAPGDEKDTYLQQYFSEVHAPDMQISIYRITRKNSILRNILTLPLFLLWLFFTVTAIIFLLSMGTLLLWLLGITAIVVFFFAIRKTIICQGVLKSLHKCVEIQTQAIKKFAPDIVVGSSWGAFIALFCAAHKVYSAPMLLIAPPAKLVTTKIQRQEIWEAICKIPKNIITRSLIIHGDKDDTVPITDSKELAQILGIKLEVINDGDHSLEGVLIQQNRFKDLVLQIWKPTTETLRT